MIISLKPTVYLKQHGDSDTVYAVDVDSPKDEILKFEDTSAFIIQQLKTPISLAEICKRIEEQYQVSDPQSIEDDVLRLLQHLNKIGFIETRSSKPTGKEV